MKISTKVTSVLLLFLLVFQTSAEAQNTKKQLEGFYYKELLVNADATAKNLPLVIAMHWMRSNPDEFEQYLNGFKNPVRVLLVEGSYPYEEGFSFYPTSPENYYKMSEDDKMKILIKESDKLAKFVKVAAILYPSEKKPIVIGASQGGDLSYMMGIRHNDKISLAIPLLATVDNRLIPKAETKPAAAIIAFHGEEDTIVAVKTAKAHIKALTKNGYTARIKTYKGLKHDVSDSMRADYSKLIDSFITAPTQSNP